MHNIPESGTPEDAPADLDAIEDSAELQDDKDASPEEPIAIELPLDPSDASGQPV